MQLHSLTAAEKRASVRALALVAWADRVLTREERAVVVAYAARLTGLEEGAVAAGLDEGKNLLKYGADIGAALRDLNGISMDVGLELLRCCYDVGASDRQLNDAELKMIALVAAQFIPRHRVVHVVRWLRTRRELLRLEGQLSAGAAAQALRGVQGAGGRSAAKKRAGAKRATKAKGPGRAAGARAKGKGKQAKRPAAAARGKSKPSKRPAAAARSKSKPSKRSGAKR